MKRSSSFVGGEWISFSRCHSEDDPSLGIHMSLTQDKGGRCLHRSKGILRGGGRPHSSKHALVSE